jgi:hypothetical protein
MGLESYEPNDLVPSAYGSANHPGRISHICYTFMMEVG